MQPLIGSDRRDHPAPKTVLAEPYVGRCPRTGAPIALPVGAEVRQSQFDAASGQMQAFVNGEWRWVIAP